MSSFSKEDFIYIKDCFKNGMSESEVAKMYEGDNTEILKNLKQIALSEMKSQKTEEKPEKKIIEWDMWETINLQRYFYLDISDAEIAKKMKKEEKEIRSKLKALGLNRKKNESTEKDQQRKCRKIFGLNLYEARKKKGLLAGEVEHRFEWANSTLIKYEKGDYYPAYDRLLLLCNLYGIKDPKKLFVDEESFLKQYKTELAKEEKMTAKPKPVAVTALETMKQKEMENKAKEGEKAMENNQTMSKTSMVSGITEENMKKLERIAANNGVTVPLLMNLIIREVKEDLTISISLV